MALTYEVANGIRWAPMAEVVKPKPSWWLKRLFVRETEILTTSGRVALERSWNVKGTFGAIAAVSVAGYALYKGIVWYESLLADGRKPKVGPRSEMTIPESQKAGSDLMPSDKKQLPKCQVRLAIRSGDNEFEVIGGGIRIDDYLVAPKHNFFSPNNELYVLDRDDIPKLVTGEVYDLAADVSAVLVRDWSLLKVAKTNLTPNTSVCTVSTMSSVDFRYSVGSLRSRELMGRVEYSGSTAPGFSGSPYMNGTRCAGMHVHGGTINGGYDAMYLWCRLKHLIFTSDDEDLKVIKESLRSSYKLNDEGSDVQAEKEEILTYEEVGVSKSGEPMAVGKVKGGKFLYAKAKTFERLKELQRDRDYDHLSMRVTNWADEADADEEYRELQDNVRKNRYEPEALVGPMGAHYSGESQPQAERDAACRVQLQSLQASASSKGEARQPQGKAARVMERFANLSFRQQKNLMAYFESSKQRNQTTAQPTQVPKPNGRVSSPN